MSLNRFIVPENVCYISVLIFAFWYVEFKLATKMKKLEQVDVDTIELNSLMFMVYSAIILYLFDARFNIVLLLLSNTFTLFIHSMLKYSNFRIDSLRLVIFSVSHGIHTYMINDWYIYLFLSIILYLTFPFFIKAYITTSFILGVYILTNNIFSLSKYYFILSNCLIFLLIISYCILPTIMTSGYYKKVRLICTWFIIPFLLVLFETNNYKHNIFFYDVKYMK
tara:strand:+ start:5953 stop:6621 length:669 start_codon:yes stop_codon:yes gene_type:complete